MLFFFLHCQVNQFFVKVKNWCCVDHRCHRYLHLCQVCRWITMLVVLLPVVTMPTGQDFLHSQRHHQQHQSPYRNHFAINTRWLDRESSSLILSAYRNRGLTISSTGNIFRLLAAILNGKYLQRHLLMISWQGKATRLVRSCHGWLVTSETLKMSYFS